MGTSNSVGLVSNSSSYKLAASTATAWLDEIAAANRSGKRHCIALSGGRITLKFFASVIGQARARNTSFANVHFFTHRVTLGYTTIAAARHVWVLASGNGKEAALRESLKPDGQTPLARVLRSRNQSEVFTDIRLN